MSQSILGIFSPQEKLSTILLVILFVKNGIFTCNILSETQKNLLPLKINNNLANDPNIFFKTSNLVPDGSVFSTASKEIE